jgi:hypothetical protein
MASTNGNSPASAEEESPIISTSDEEGVHHQFQMVDMVEIEGQQYGLLLYLGEEDENGALKPKVAEEASSDDDSDEEDDDEFVIMRIEEEDGASVFISIDDDDEYERIIQYFEMEDEDLEFVEEESENN